MYIEERFLRDLKEMQEPCVEEFNKDGEILTTECFLRDFSPEDQVEILIAKYTKLSKVEKHKRAMEEIRKQSRIQRMHLLSAELRETRSNFLIRWFRKLSRRLKHRKIESNNYGGNYGNM